MPNIVSPIGENDIYLTPFRVHTASIFQTGTNDPVATIFNSNDSNFLGSIVWARNNQGDYTGTLEGAFPAGKTYITANTDGAHGEYYMEIGRIDQDSLQLYNINASGVLSDGVNGYVEIRVYP